MQFTKDEVCSIICYGLMFAALFKALQLKKGITF